LQIKNKKIKSRRLSSSKAENYLEAEVKGRQMIANTEK
jgi:hypothetical protein